MKKYICLKIQLFLIVTGFSVVMLSGMDKAPLSAKKHSLMRRDTPVASSRVSLLEKLAFWRQISPKIHLVPTDMSSMKELGLCPLFDKQEELQLDPEVLADMTAGLRMQGLSEADIKQQLAGLSAENGPQCHVFKQERRLPSGEMDEAGFKSQPVDVNAPCVVPLGIRGENKNCTLMQLRSLDQFELAKKTGLSPALCAGHALNNGCFIRNYAETGEVKYLKDLHDINAAANFLLDLTIDDWLNVEVVKANLEKMREKFDVDVSNISAVSSVELFDSSLNKTPHFSLFSPEEFTYVQELKRKIRTGLFNDTFDHVIIIGNEEVAESHGHYFVFVIIKLGNEIQYVVLDTLPKVYHLQEGSHERDRLMFLIQNIMQGSSDIKLANIRRYMLQQHGAFDVPEEK